MKRHTLLHSDCDCIVDVTTTMHPSGNELKQRFVYHDGGIYRRFNLADKVCIPCWHKRTLHNSKHMAVQPGQSDKALHSDLRRPDGSVA